MHAAGVIREVFEEVGVAQLDENGVCATVVADFLDYVGSNFHPVAGGIE